MKIYGFEKIIIRGVIVGEDLIVVVVWVIRLGWLVRIGR